jgi:hypothetical protein
MTGTDRATQGALAAVSIPQRRPPPKDHDGPAELHTPRAQKCPGCGEWLLGAAVGLVAGAQVDKQVGEAAVRPVGPGPHVLQRNGEAVGDLGVGELPMVL